MDKTITAFIKKNGINKQKIVDMLTYTKNALPSARFNYDITTYAHYGVLRVEITYQDKKIQPLLFGVIEHLENLNHDLWEQSTHEWQEKMEDIAHRGTFLKKEVLVKKITSLVDQYATPTTAILDVGCGEGVLIRELVQQYPLITGFDTSSYFIERLQKTIPDIKGHLFVANLLDISTNKKYPLLIVSMLLLDIPAINQALEQLYNLLENNGILIIADINARYYKSLGFWEDNILHVIHDPKKIFHTEKMISGHTKAIHNYHPFDFYKEYLTQKGLVVLHDQEHGPTAQQINEHPTLNDKEKARLLQELSKDILSPPFHIIILQKHDIHV